MPPFTPGPRRRRLGVTYGGTPLKVPLVAAVGVNNLTATGANLVGSVNPQGLSASWWFVYGTTPQFGSQTSAQNLAATSIPQTETLSLSGLITNTTYYFAVVAQTAAGTVTSAPLSFTPQVPTVVIDASNPVQSTATPEVSIPHWKFPVTFSAQHGVGVVEQDTLDEVFSNVQAIVACPVGACPELPTFGVPQLTFGTAPLDPSSVVSAIQTLEPRAGESAISEALPNTDPNGGSWKIALTTQYAGGGA